MAAVIAGCGGNGGGSNTSPNPFAGAYTGLYNAFDRNEANTEWVRLHSGNVNPATIGTDGSVSVVYAGTYVSGGASVSGTFTGTVQSNGSFSGQFLEGSATFNMTGTFTQDPSGNVVIDATTSSGPRRRFVGALNR